MEYKAEQWVKITYLSESLGITLKELKLIIQDLDPQYINKYKTGMKRGKNGWEEVYATTYDKYAVENLIKGK